MNIARVTLRASSLLHNTNNFKFSRSVHVQLVHNVKGRYTLEYNVTKKKVKPQREPEEAERWRQIRKLNRTENPEKIPTVLNDMKILGVAPDVRVLTACVNILAKAKQYEEAHKLFQDMTTEYKIEPTLNLYTFMINLCKFRKEFHSFAQKYFDDMQKLQIAPTARTYTNLMNIYAQGRNKEGLNEVFSAYQANGNIPIVPMYNILAKFYSEKQDAEGLKGVIQEMKNKEASPNVITYNLLLASYTMPRQKEELMATFEEIAAGGMGSTVQPDHYTYTIMMDKMYRCKDVRGAYAYYERMRRARVKGTAYTYKTLLRCCVLESSLKDVQVNPEHEKHILVVTSKSYAVRAHHYLRFMRRSGMVPDAEMFALLKTLVTKRRAAVVKQRQQRIGLLKAVRKQEREEIQQIKKQKKEEAQKALERQAAIHRQREQERQKRLSEMGKDTTQSKK